MSYLTTSQSQAIQFAKNYRGAKASLQYAIGYAVNQLMHGNADGLHQVMSASGLIENHEGEMHANADGRAVWKYITHKDALGLSGVVRWDEDDGRFKMCKNWKIAADELDVEILLHTLTYIRWDQFESVKVDKAFDLDSVVARMIKRARSEGCTTETIESSMRRLLAA